MSRGSIVALLIVLVALPLSCMAASILLFFFAPLIVDTRFPGGTPSLGSTESFVWVRGIVAEQMGVPLTQVSPETTLGDLGADELDLVELVMELEDRFDISIDDSEIEKLAEPLPLSQGMSEITVGKVASLVDRLRGKAVGSKHRGTLKNSAEFDALRRSQTVLEKKSDAPPLETLTYGQLKNEALSAEGSSEPQIPVFLNPLVMLLAGHETQLGRPLTRVEVLEVRDDAQCILMNQSQAEKFYVALDSRIPVPRINPERCWEEWQEIRMQLKSPK